MLERGVFLPPAQFEAWFVSTAHSDADLRRTMLAHASYSYLLAEPSALGTVAAHRIAGLAQLSGVVSASAPPVELTTALRAAGAELVLPS